MRTLLVAGVLLFGAGCGGAEPTGLIGEGADGAAATDGGPMVDGGGDAAADTGTPPPVCSADGGACNAPDVPNGFKPVLLAKGAQPCPQGFGPAADVAADPVVGANACSCSCTKTQDPDCQTGTTTITGVGAMCGGFSVNLMYSGGTCRKTSGTVDDYDKATTIPGTGGTCAVQAVANDKAVTSDAVRLCAASDACAPATCGGYAPKGFTACIVADGDVPCPNGSPFATKHLVGTQASLQCSSCGAGCTFQGKCDGAKLSFFSDQNCQQLIVSIPANGTCTQTGKANAVLGGTMYTASPNFSGCTATGTSTGTASMQAPRTVCCR